MLLNKSLGLGLHANTLQIGISLVFVEVISMIFCKQTFFDFIMFKLFLTILLVSA